MLETIREKKELGLKGVAIGLTFYMNCIIEDGELKSVSCQCVKESVRSQTGPEGVVDLPVSIPVCDIYYSQGLISVNNMSSSESKGIDAISQFKTFLNELMHAPKVEVKA